MNIVSWAPFITALMTAINVALFYDDPNAIKLGCTIVSGAMFIVTTVNWHKNAKT